MRIYRLQDVIYLPKNKMLHLENEDKEQVGYIQKEKLPGYEKGNLFSYTSLVGQSKVLVGIRKSGLKRFVMAEYGVIVEEQTYTLKDKLGNNFLYFCVLGNLENHTIRIEENWDENVVIKVDKEKVAFIEVGKDFSTVRFQFDESISEQSVIFAVTILMYFMFNIYKRETKVVEELLT